MQIQEGELIDEIQRAEELPSGGIHVVSEVVVRRNVAGRWEVDFIFKETTKCKIQTRRGELKEFRRLNGVLEFMERIKVHSFQVEM